MYMRKYYGFEPPLSDSSLDEEHWLELLDEWVDEMTPNNLRYVIKVAILRLEDLEEANDD